MDDKFNIVFAGNIGQAQGLDILAEAAYILKDKKYSEKIRFNIIGDGRYKEELLSIIEKKKVDKMFNFIPRQPAIRIPEFMAVNDAAFLCLTDSPLFSMTIPAKLQSYMACGIPILASANGETQKIVQESKSGYCSAAGDAEKLVENIIKLLSDSEKTLKEFSTNARLYYEHNFDKEKLLDEIEEYF